MLANRFVGDHLVMITLAIIARHHAIDRAVRELLPEEVDAILIQVGSPQNLFRENPVSDFPVSYKYIGRQEDVKMVGRVRLFFRTKKFW